MEEHGLDDEQVGAAVGVSPRTVMGWRRALLAPLLPRCEQLAELFGVSVWDFYDKGR